MNLKTYEGQARLSISLAIVASVFALAAGFLILQNFRTKEFATFYNPNSLRQPLVLATVGFSVLCGSIGLFLGISSAEQRRNTKPKLSWTGFFFSAAAVTLALSLGIFFWSTKLPLGG